MRALGLLLSLWLAAVGHGQYWKAIGLGTVDAREVQTLFGDEASDRLLAGGTFQYIRNVEDTVLGLGQAAWNGLRWDSVAHRLQSFIGNSTQQTYWFLRYQGVLYCCGNFAYYDENNNLNGTFARLNEATNRWGSLGCDIPGMAGIATLVPKEPGTVLYATGYQDPLCGLPTSCVFRYDGTSFSEWLPFQQIPPEPNNSVGYVFDFRGMTYITGNFPDPQSNGTASLLRYNGSSWETVPGWNTISSIKEFSIHNDTLYVAGTFRVATGAPGDLIARFDGTTWDDMGGGMLYEPVPMSSAILAMTWYHGELWVAGFFTRAGDIAAESIAKWNGHQWCSLPADFQGQQPNATVVRIVDMAVWRDSLYICGGFRWINGVPIKQVAQWLGGDVEEACSTPVGVAEPRMFPTLHVYPNPSEDLLTIQGLGSGAFHFVVKDALGRTVLEQVSGTHLLDVSALPGGSYTIACFEHAGKVIGQSRFIRP